MVAVLHGGRIAWWPYCREKGYIDLSPRIPDDEAICEQRYRQEYLQVSTNIYKFHASKHSSLAKIHITIQNPAKEIWKVPRSPQVLTQQLPLEVHSFQSFAWGDVINIANFTNVKQRFFDRFPFNARCKWGSVSEKIRRVCNLKKFGSNTFFHLTFGIADRYKICIGFRKLIKGTKYWPLHLKY